MRNTSFSPLCAAFLLLMLLSPPAAGAAQPQKPVSSPLTITGQHHHDQFDLFPDFGRQVPFGTGTSIFYNYLDYRFRNDTEQTYQLLVHTMPTHLCGELRTDAPLAVKYHIAAENERFVREDGVVYRCGEVYRTMVDKTTGNVLSRELLRRNHARVLYDTAGLEIMDR